MTATRRVVRFHDDPEGPGLRSLTLPGLPEPRFKAVNVGAEGDGQGVVVDVEVRRGTEPAVTAFVMLSVATRNPALTRAEFAGRWRAEAGRLGSEPIPADVQGIAYAQLHPVGDDPPYDAISMVWFEDLAGLQRRAEWFAARDVPADLFADAWSLYLRG